LYENWLRDLAGVVDEVNADRNARAKTALWVFSGYNTVTTEEVPDWSDDKRGMRYYWNSVLYTAETGDLIVARMLGLKGSTASPPGDFGRRLSGDTLEAVRTRIRERRRLYMASHPDEVRNVRRLASGVAFKPTPANACCF
jgi:hypothetical protein